PVGGRGADGDAGGRQLGRDLVAVAVDRLAVEGDRGGELAGLGVGQGSGLAELGACPAAARRDGLGPQLREHGDAVSGERLGGRGGGPFARVLVGAHGDEHRRVDAVVLHRRCHAGSGGGDRVLNVDARGEQDLAAVEGDEDQGLGGGEAEQGGDRGDEVGGVADSDLAHSVLLDCWGGSAWLPSLCLTLLMVLLPVVVTQHEIVLFSVVCATLSG